MYRFTMDTEKVRAYIELIKSKIDELEQDMEDIDEILDDPTVDPVHSEQAFEEGTYYLKQHRFWSQELKHLSSAFDPECPF